MQHTRRSLPPVVGASCAKRGGEEFFRQRIGLRIAYLASAHCDRAEFVYDRAEDSTCNLWCLRELISQADPPARREPQGYILVKSVPVLRGRPDDRLHVVSAETFASALDCEVKSDEPVGIDA